MSVFSISDSYYEKKFSEEVEDFYNSSDHSENQLLNNKKNELRENYGISINGEISPDQRGLSLKTILFLKKLSEAFQAGILNSVIISNDNDVDSAKNSKKRKILQYIQKNKLYMPQFTIAVDDYSKKKLLLETGHDNVLILPGSFLVVFNLPKRMARHWWKGGEGENALPGPFYIEWGRFYRENISIIWDFVDRAYYYGIDIQRINGLKIHDPDKYYYIWEINNED